MRFTFTHDDGRSWHGQVDRVAGEYFWSVWEVRPGGDEKLRYGTSPTMTASVQRATDVIIERATKAK